MLSAVCYGWFVRFFRTALNELILPFVSRSTDLEVVLCFMPQFCFAHVLTVSPNSFFDFFVVFFPSSSAHIQSLQLQQPKNSYESTPITHGALYSNGVENETNNKMFSFAIRFIQMRIKFSKELFGFTSQPASQMLSIQFISIRFMLSDSPSLPYIHTHSSYFACAQRKFAFFSYSLFDFQNIHSIPFAFVHSFA